MKKRKTSEAVASLRTSGDPREGGWDPVQEVGNSYDSPVLRAGDRRPFTFRLVLETHGHCVLPSTFHRTDGPLTKRELAPMAD